MKFNLVEKYRKQHPLCIEHKAGDPFGWFMIQSEYDRQWLYCMACAAGVSDSEEEKQWDHVSVSKENGKTPNWRDQACWDATKDKECWRQR